MGPLTFIDPPANAADVSAAHETVGVELPADLVAWWRRADGRAQAGAAGTKAGMGLPGFLPMATDCGGADLFGDLRSGPEHGCVREFDKVHTDGNPRWANVTAMLADIADALAYLSAIDGFHPRLDHDGTLHWEYRDLNSR